MPESTPDCDDATVESAREETERLLDVIGEVDPLIRSVCDVNPHALADHHGDPETLLGDLTAAEAETATYRDQLKAILAEALAQ